jgi:transcriptional regulator with XRE-family HTH domain
VTKGEFKELRKQLGYSQVRLAAEMGTTKASISRYESGDRPISELVARFLTLLVHTQGKRTGGR